MSDQQNIIVIGASAGGISATSKLVAKLPSNINAAIFIVIHVAKDSRTEVILRQLQKEAILPCVLPKDGDSIKNNTIYLAPADHHMLLAEEKILIKHGPRENHWRPAIDVLFRSAAASYGGCVTGIILTGLLDDGTSGMEAIKKAGGLAIVQDPAQAEFTDMPNNVLQNMIVDHSALLEDMPYILVDHFAGKTCKIDGIPDDVKLEAAITLRMSSNVEELAKLADTTPLTCPDCGGTLMKIKGEKHNRYRCYTGHSFSELALEKEQLNGIENSLWVAIRMMEERKNLLNNMESYQPSTKMERAQEMGIHIKRLKEMLQGINNSLINDDSVN
jgi:two-component system chemotaxis response regulator CheB